MPLNRIAMARLTGIFRLQLVWSIIFSHGSSYLFSLGSTKSQSSLIWAIGPICGAVVQPIIGVVADDSRSSWGRRRPFIVGGAIGTVISLLALAWVSNFMRALARAFGVGSDEGVKTMIHLGTVIFITFLNLSIQPLQLGLRTLIVDVCPPEQQSIASAWAGRFTSIGNILGYIVGSLQLGFIPYDDEAWRFRFLSLFCVVVLLTTVSITAYFIREESPSEVTQEPKTGILPLRVLRNLKNGWAVMPSQSRRVCLVQFFAWMGWFGFLFYSTSYVGRLYFAESLRRGVENFDFLRDTGIRLGTFASLLSALIALATIVIAPIITSSDSTVVLFENTLTMGQVRWWRQIHIIWTLSHLLYAFCTFCTLFVSSTKIEMFLIALTGVSWGVTQWAPFAILGKNIATWQAERDLAFERGEQLSTSNQSGAIIGAHNAAISVPQILAALGSSVIFSILDGRGASRSDDIAWVLRASGLAALVAAYFAWRLEER